MFEFNADGYGILQVHPNQASRPYCLVSYWSDTYYYKKLSVKIMFLVNEGLFEHFLINKVRENVEIREIKNIQIPFRTHGNVLFRTCYRMYSYVKFKTFPFFYPKILEIHKKTPVLWSHPPSRPTASSTISRLRRDTNTGTRAYLTSFGATDLILRKQLGS